MTWCRTLAAEPITPTLLLVYGGSGTDRPGRVPDDRSAPMVLGIAEASDPSLDAEHVAGVHP